MCTDAQIRRPIAAFIAAGVLLLGCAEEAAQNAHIAPPVLAISAPALSQSVPGDSVAVCDIVTTASSNLVIPTEMAGADAVGIKYEPPFPDRVDLFVPPKRPATSTADAVQHNAVELMGFVRVDQQRAVLSIDGNVASIPVGQSQFGVEVLSIAPPKVELQRGRQRWHATLE